MKVNPGDFDTSKWYLNPNHGIKPGVYNEINENLKVHPFVYKSDDPDYFRLVLEWELVIKSVDQSILILTFNGTHEFIMQLDGNNDKETLLRMIASSHLNFDMQLQEKTKNTVLAHYKLKGEDFNESADTILVLARKQ